VKSIKFSEALLATLLGLVLVASVASPLAAQRAQSSAPTPPPPAEGDVSHESLRLLVGEQKVLDSEGVRSFSEGVKGIVDVRLTKDNDKFVIVGLKEGRTTVLFIMLDGSEVHYDVVVDDPNGTIKKPAADIVETRDNIRLDFYFVQLSENYNHNIGIGWPGSIGGTARLNVGLDLQSGSLTNATAVVSEQVLPRLDVAQADGWAKVLRKAAVITANGTQATFSGGGELNVIVTGGFGGTIKQIRFGSEIGVKPRYDKQSGRIELQITADVSDLTADNGTGVPGRTVSTLQTVVNLELGQSLALAGLTSASETHSTSGLPGLSQIPVIGLLFGSNGAQTSQTENVVFIVPSVIDTVSMQQRTLIDEALSAYENYEGELEDAPQLMPKGRNVPEPKH